VAVDSVKTKILLALGGTLLGVLLGFAGGKIVAHFRPPAMPEGSTFENVEDLRRAMLRRDGRDVLPDHSVSFRSIIAPDPSDLIIYRLRPNLDVKFRGVNVKTNSHGMRSPEVDFEKPPGTYRLALLGDSFAFGWGVDADKIFARVIEEDLNHSFSGSPKVEVLNFGVPGYSTFQEDALFEDFGVKFHPDAALVYFVQNDFGLPFFIKNFGNSDQLVNNSHFEKLRKEDDDTPAEAKNAELLKNLNANRALRRLGEFCRDKNIALFLVINPRPDWKRDYRRLRNTIKGLPNLHHLAIRDQISDLIDRGHYTGADLRLVGDPHPNAIKHQMLGQVIAQQVAPFIVDNGSSEKK
jgi:hypothetical protein